MNAKSKRNLDKKQVVHKTPNLSKMQVVVIDGRTSIYIEQDADPVLARKRYLERLAAR